MSDPAPKNDEEWMEMVDAVYAYECKTGKAEKDSKERWEDFLSSIDYSCLDIEIDKVGNSWVRFSVESPTFCYPSHDDGHDGYARKDWHLVNAIIESHEIVMENMVNDDLESFNEMIDGVRELSRRIGSAADFLEKKWRAVIKSR